MVAPVAVAQAGRPVERVVSDRAVIRDDGWLIRTKRDCTAISHTPPLLTSGSMSIPRFRQWSTQASHYSTNGWDSASRLDVPGPGWGRRRPISSSFNRASTERHVSRIRLANGLSSSARSFSSCRITSWQALRSARSLLRSSNVVSAAYRRGAHKPVTSTINSTVGRSSTWQQRSEPPSGYGRHHAPPDARKAHTGFEPVPPP